MPLGEDVLQDIKANATRAIARLREIERIAGSEAGPAAHKRIQDEIRLATRYLHWIEEDAPKIA